MITDKVMNHANPETKSLSYEKRKKRWPIEYALKELNAELAKTPVITTVLEMQFYENLVKLSKAVMSHKYGTSSRIDYETASHDIAASVFMTIVKKRKEVYSWTNLLKKVVRDYVSNHLRKEYYDTLQTVKIDQHQHDDDGGEGGGDNQAIESYRNESANEIKTEDLIYFKQQAGFCVTRIRRVYRRITNLSDLLILRLAVHEVVKKVKHNHFVLLRKEDHIRYNYYMFVLQFELAPVLNHNYSQRRFHA